MSSDLQALVQDHDWISFIQVFLCVSIVVISIYAIRAILRPADPVRPTTGRAIYSQTTLAARLANSRSQVKPEDFTTPKPALSLQMPTDLHWQRAIAPLHLSIERGRRAAEFHRQALIRLDAADYAFERMLEDLGSVLTLSLRPVSRKSLEVSSLAPNAAPISLAA